MSDTSQGKQCIACNNTNKIAKSVSYFRVPPDPILATQWLKNLKRLDLIDSVGVQGLDKNYFVCSDHFDEPSMYTQGTANPGVIQKRLRKNAVPLVLDSPDEVLHNDDVDGSNEVNGGNEAFDGSLFDMLSQNMTTEENISFGNNFENDISSSAITTTDEHITDYNLDMFEDLEPGELAFYKSLYKSVDQIIQTRIHCTSCNYHIGTAPINEAIVRMHPVLRVTQCKKCYTFYNSGEFEKGDDGSELYCRWCGQGGEVYCCSSCPYVFCRRCIVQNLTKSCVTDIQNTDNWDCFQCEPKLMVPLRAQHWALVNFMEKQKREITKSSSNERQISQLMSKDLSTCCSSKPVKKLAPKRKSESSVIDSIPPAKKPIKAFTPKLLNPSLPTTAGKQNEEIVQCTPDILSMFNNQDENQSQIMQSGPTTSNGQSHHEAPPLRLIRREVAIKDTGKTVGQVATPIHVATATTTNPVYHTINGFRIDLNTAAQSETYRLPNGKLIQVKKQSPAVATKTTTVTTPATPTTTNRAMNIMPRTVQLSIRPTGPATTIHQQLQQQYQQQQQQHHQQQQLQQHLQNAQLLQTQNVTQYRTLMPNLLQNQLSQPGSAIVSNNLSQPPPLVIRTTASSSPMSTARQQFEQRVDNSFELCQHIIGKIRTLTFSSAYKNAQSLTDLKDLTIHLSYLLTYAIGRLKTLQEKCTEDMDKMAVTENKKNAAGGDEDDDDIEIVEPSKTIIEIDSDNEEEIKTTTTTQKPIAKVNKTKNPNNVKNISRTQKTSDKQGENVELLTITDKDVQHSNGLQTQVNRPEESIPKANDTNADEPSKTDETIGEKISSDSEKDSSEQSVMEVDGVEKVGVTEKTDSENGKTTVDSETQKQNESNKESNETEKVDLTNETDIEDSSKESSVSKTQEKGIEVSNKEEHLDSINEKNDEMVKDSNVAVSISIETNKENSDENAILENQEKTDIEKFDNIEKVNPTIEATTEEKFNENDVSQNEKETIADNPETSKNQNEREEDMNQDSKNSNEVEETNEDNKIEEKTDEKLEKSIAEDESKDSEMFDKHTENTNQDNVDPEGEKMNCLADNGEEILETFVEYLSENEPTNTQEDIDDGIEYCLSPEEDDQTVIDNGTNDIEGNESTDNYEMIETLIEENESYSGNEGNEIIHINQDIEEKESRMETITETKEDTELIPLST